MSALCHKHDSCGAANQRPLLEDLVGGHLRDPRHRETNLFLFSEIGGRCTR